MTMLQFLIVLCSLLLHARICSQGYQSNTGSQRRIEQFISDPSKTITQLYLEHKVVHSKSGQVVVFPTNPTRVICQRAFNLPKSWWKKGNLIEDRCLPFSFMFPLPDVQCLVSVLVLRLSLKIEGIIG